MNEVILSPTETFDIYVTKSPTTPKSGYRLRYSGLKGEQAIMMWRGLNIGNGYKAKFVCHDTKEILARKR